MGAIRRILNCEKRTKGFPQRRGGRDLACRWGGVCGPSARYSAIRRSLGRLRGARVRLPAWGLSSLLPFGHVIPPFGGVWTPARRAARWGRLWGYAPFSAPLASPPKHPLRRAFQISSCGEGNAAIASEASFPRSARSGDLPPRRVNAIVRFRFDQYPLQPTILSTCLTTEHTSFPFNASWAYSQSASSLDKSKNK